MEGYTLMINILTWGIRIIGSAVFVFGILRLFQSIGESGTGNDRVLGTITSLGGIALIVFSTQTTTLFPAPTF